MPISDARLLQLAISGLEAQREGIDEEIAQLRKRAGIRGPFRAAKAGKAARKGRRSMSPAERKAVSERMKKMWAARRKAQK